MESKRLTPAQTRRSPIGGAAFRVVPPRAPEPATGWTGTEPAPASTDNPADSAE